MVIDRAWHLEYTKFFDFLFVNQRQFYLKLTYWAILLQVILQVILDLAKALFHLVLLLNETSFQSFNF